MTIKRWALWSKDLQAFYKPLPHQTEILYDSRRSAIAARLGGSLYSYQPVKVELRYQVNHKECHEDKELLIQQRDTAYEKLDAAQVLVSEARQLLREALKWTGIDPTAAESDRIAELDAEIRAFLCKRA